MKTFVLAITVAMLLAGCSGDMDDTTVAPPVYGLFKRKSIRPSELKGCSEVDWLDTPASHEESPEDIILIHNAQLQPMLHSDDTATYIHVVGTTFKDTVVHDTIYKYKILVDAKKVRYAGD